jgi:hypothetical protein
MRSLRQAYLVVSLGVLIILAAAPGALGLPHLPTRTDESASPEYILGSILDIWVGNSDNIQPAIAYNSLHDEFLVVWTNEHPGGTWDIYARRLGSDWSLKSEFTVINNAGYKNWQPTVAYSPQQDEYLVVYTWEGVPDDYNLFARRISWNGSWLSPEFPISVDGDKQWNPAVAYNSQNDEYLVVYENWWDGGLRDIAAQRVRAADGDLLSWRNIATGPAQQRVFPDVAYDPGRNGYLIVYGYGVGSNGQIYGKMTSWNMADLSPEIHIVDDSFDQDFPAVAAGQDEFLVVWEDGTFGTDDYDVYGRRLAADGTPLGPSTGFAIAANTPHLHVDPKVAYGSGYGYLVSWRFFDPGPTGEDVYARYVPLRSNAAVGEEVKIDASEDAQRFPGVACSAQHCLVAYDDNYRFGAGVSDFDIRGRFVIPHHVFLPAILRSHS